MICPPPPFLDGRLDGHGSSPGDTFEGSPEAIWPERVRPPEQASGRGMVKVITPGSVCVCGSIARVWPAHVSTACSLDEGLCQTAES
jgi:hypothetical protein